MKPDKGQRKFKLETKYIHQRSEGLVSRRNGGSIYQPEGSAREGW